MRIETHETLGVTRRRILSAVNVADGIDILLRLSAAAPSFPGKRRMFFVQNEGISFQHDRLENGIAVLHDVGSFALRDAVVREPISIVIAHGIKMRWAHAFCCHLFDETLFVGGAMRLFFRIFDRFLDVHHRIRNRRHVFLNTAWNVFLVERALA